MLAWHFVNEDRRLGYGDNRIVKQGRVYKVPQNRPLKLCEYGLHASKRILDALQYAPGPVLCRVELRGKMFHDSDKSVAYERKVLWMMDATDVLRSFSRRCALDVVHLWDPPEIVMQYLKTGDESIRGAARAAARSGRNWVAAWVVAWAAASATAWVAARDADRDAAWVAARDAAWVAARDTAWVADRDAARDADRDAARDAARDADRKKQNMRLTSMVMVARRK